MLHGPAVPESLLMMYLVKNSACPLMNGIQRCHVSRVIIDAKAHERFCNTNCVDDRQKTVMIDM